MHTLVTSTRALAALPLGGTRRTASPIHRFGLTLLLAAATSAAASASAVSAPHRAAAGPHRNAAAVTSLQNLQGLAIAANGDLYVADFGGNAVTVYGSNLVQKSASTIVTGLDGPTGVAFDSTGNAYVNNYLSAQVTVYNANGCRWPAGPSMASAAAASPSTR